MAASTRTSTGNLFVAADALDVFLLQHAQELDLGAQAQVADFVEKNGAVVGLLEAAHAAGVRAGEGAAFVAEQFAFQQGFRNGRAVDGDERLRGALAVLVNRARDQFLAGAGFAANQHGDGGGGHAPDFLVDGLHGAAVADDGGLGRPGFPHFQRFGHEPAAGHGLGDQIEQFAHVKRLEEIVVGAELGGFNGGFGGAERGHHDDGQLRLGGMELLDQFEAGQARHLQIGEHHVAGFAPWRGPGPRRRAWPWRPDSLRPATPFSAPPQCRGRLQ